MSIPANPVIESHWGIFAASIFCSVWRNCVATVTLKSPEQKIH